MKLDRVFELNHQVAILKGTKRPVVHLPSSMEGKPAGYYALDPEAVDVVTAARKVCAQDLGPAVAGAEVQSADWGPDHAHCWCESCAGTRKMFATRVDDE